MYSVQATYVEVSPPTPPSFPLSRQMVQECFSGVVKLLQAGMIPCGDFPRSVALDWTTSIQRFFALLALCLSAKIADPQLLPLQLLQAVITYLRVQELVLVC